MNARTPALVLAALCCSFFLPTRLFAQQNQESDPSSALIAALSAACRSNDAQFAAYLTADNTAAFRALPPDQRVAFLKRFSLADDPGKPLLSSDERGHSILRCTAPEGTAEFRLGDARTRENLSFIPVTVVDGERTEFGLVRENGGWRLLSLGLLILDVPQLSKQWAESALISQEDSAVATLQKLAGAMETYRRAYGKLPDALSQLGPAPKDQISTEQASLVDAQLAAGNSGGYQFRYRVVPAAQSADDSAFELSAAPSEYGKTGRRSFLLDAAGKIHAADHHGALATAGDPLVASASSP